MMTFDLLVGIVAAIAGGIASVVGFGIGSLMTPVYALRLDTKVAVAAVSIPHLFGTALRFWRLRRHIDRKILFSFGIASALGGFGGALLHNFASSRVLQLAFGALLIFAGTSELSGLARRMRFGAIGSWIAGTLSGTFGGLVGNQGGIRSAALLTFDIPKESFVGTATAIALLVDFGRMPVYAASESQQLVQVWPLITIGVVGVLAGTLAGTAFLTKLPERIFRRVVAVIVLALGVYMLFASR